MEQEQKPKTLSTASNSSIHIDYTSLIRECYNKAYTSLENYQPRTVQSLKDILEVSAQIKALKSKKIEAQEIGTFAFRQPYTKPVFIADTTPYHNPLYTSIILKRIAQYNDHIEKNNLTAPTTEQFNNYISNIKNKDIIDESFTDFGLETDDSTKNRVIVVLPKEVTESAQALDTLIENIMNIKKASPQKIHRLAYIHYQGNK